jgi:hypothetical protein
MLHRAARCNGFAIELGRSWTRQVQSIATHRVPLTARVLSRDPAVYLLPNFLTPAECADLRKLGGPLLEQSKISAFEAVPLYWGETSAGAHGVDAVRTSSSAALTADHGCSWLVERARKSFCLDIPAANFEPPQVCHYKPGQEYKAHYDAFEAGDASLNVGGQRVGTVIVYLAEAPVSGGGTSFPSLGTCAGATLAPILPLRCSLACLQLPRWSHLAPSEVTSVLQRCCTLVEAM